MAASLEPNIFSSIFLYENCCISIEISQKCVSKHQFIDITIDSDSGFALKRWQAIIWTKGDLVCWCINVSLGLNESRSSSVCSLSQIWLRFVPKSSIDTIQWQVQIMFWHITDDKPLSEPMMAKLTDVRTWMNVRYENCLCNYSIFYLYVICLYVNIVL